jgi:hypothetical protein
MTRSITVGSGIKGGVKAAPAPLHSLGIIASPVLEQSEQHQIPCNRSGRSLLDRTGARHGTLQNLDERLQRARCGIPNRPKQTQFHDIFDGLFIHSVFAVQSVVAQAQKAGLVPELQRSYPAAQMIRRASLSGSLAPLERLRAFSHSPRMACQSQSAQPGT